MAERIAPATMAPKDGFGRTPIATANSSLFANIVSHNLSVNLIVRETTYLIDTNLKVQSRAAGLNNQPTVH